MISQLLLNSFLVGSLVEPVLLNSAGKHLNLLSPTFFWLTKGQDACENAHKYVISRGLG